MSTILVGDPVDIITGVQFDVALDFRIAWSFPFEWRRLYSTARVTEFLPLGWGHTHSYDHRLKFDIDGLIYIDPTGARHGFSYPALDKFASFSATGRLLRVNPHILRVKVRSQPECEFHFTDPAQPAQLRKLFLGKAYHELRYRPDGRWSQLVYRTEPPIRVESAASGIIHALIWAGADNGRDRLLWSGQYDNKDNLASVVDPYRTTQTFGYDAEHRMIHRKDRRGYGFVASYDRNGRCDRSAGEDGMQEVRLRYLPAANLTVVTRADNGEWQYFHQPEGVTQIIDPYGGVTQRSYGADGRLVREVGPMGEVLREMAYGESGFLHLRFGPPSGMCLPLGDPWFEPIRSLSLPTDVLGCEGYGAARCRNAIRFPSRDSSGVWMQHLPAAVINGIRFAERLEENKRIVVPSGHGPAPKKPIGVPGRPGVMHHDAFGRLLRHILPTGHTAHWRYDPNGNVVRYVDYAGSEWRYDYASWNLCVRESDPLGHTVAYTFNALEKPIRIDDSGGTSTTHEFDLKDRMIKRSRHGAYRDVFRYNLSSGFVSTSTSSGAVNLTLAFGPQSRPVEIAPADRPVRRCAYDERGWLVSVLDSDGESVTFAYDILGHATADLQNGRGVTRRYNAGRPIECIVLGKFVIRYIHHTDDGQMTIIDPAGGHHVVQQLDTGIFLRKQANRTSELTQFDWNGQCLGKFRFRDGESYRIWSRVYQYSPVGALLIENDSHRGTSAYEYDAAHRLVGATSTDGQHTKFRYDAAGNLLAAPGLGDVFYAENRLLTANGRRFEYNERHHIVRDWNADMDRQYDYDAEDRLTACHTGSNRIEFHYDALGRRLAKTASGSRAEFVWDGERLGAEIFPTGEFRVYVYADEKARTPFAFIDYDSLDADPVSGRRRYIFSNQIACPVLVEDDAGQVLWRARIDPYGRAVIEPNSRVVLSLRWPGHYFDSETGLHYNRFRYYSPELGRYIQVDPRDLEGGVNVYAYSARPLDKVDVDGLKPCNKNPMVSPEETDEGFRNARDEADKVSKAIRKALDDLVSRGQLHPKRAAAITLTAMVVLRKDDHYNHDSYNKFEIVITSNVSPRTLPQRVHSAMGGHRIVAWGQDRPPNILQNLYDYLSWCYGRTKDDGTLEGTYEESTHKHAEQRGLRALDCDENVKGVAYVAPTRPCCEGCYAAITTPYNEGGWGGTQANISEFGNKNAG